MQRTLDSVLAADKPLTFPAGDLQGAADEAELPLEAIIHRMKTLCGLTEVDGMVTIPSAFEQKFHLIDSLIGGQR